MPGDTYQLGYAALVLGLLAYLPYIRDTLSGHTRPERASWTIWTIMSGLSFQSQAYEGATTSLGYAWAQFAATAFILVLSIRFGTGTWMRRGDRVVLLLAAMGILTWWYVDDATTMVLIAAGVSLVGGSVTIIKAYYHPASETLITWMMSGVAATLAMLATSGGPAVLTVHPLYMFSLSFTIVAAILAGRRRWRHLNLGAGPTVG